MLSIITKDPKMKYVILNSIFPRTKSRFADAGEVGSHSLDRGILLAKIDDKHIAIKIKWAGGQLSKTSCISYDLNRIFVVQDVMIHGCAGADFNPQKPFDEGNQFEMALYFEGDWDERKPFNLIEYYHQGGFLFKGVSKEPGGKINNGTFTEKNPVFVPVFKSFP